ncbi:MAG: ATP-dependent zinc protease [Planctomycetales bacterium]|nr:ATP-dependent zinc protease [Planctomycetales bacterium]
MGRKPSTQSRRKLPRIGWREWAALPAWNIAAIKAKVDTGARTSSIHAARIERFRRQGKDWLRFDIHPMQRDAQTTVHVEAELVEYRKVTSSNGQTSLRPVVETQLQLSELTWTIELTLAGRDAMGFRMLLGREALRNRFLIDVGRSFLASQPPPSLGPSKRRS